MKKEYREEGNDVLVWLDTSGWTNQKHEMNEVEFNEECVDI